RVGEASHRACGGRQPALVIARPFVHLKLIVAVWLPGAAPNAVTGPKSMDGVIASPLESKLLVAHWAVSVAFTSNFWNAVPANALAVPIAAAITPQIRTFFISPSFRGSNQPTNTWPLHRQIGRAHV